MRRHPVVTGVAFGVAIAIPVSILTTHNCPLALNEVDLYGSRELTNREKRIVELLSQGMKNSEIGEAMGVSEHVIRNYLRVIYDKTGMWTRLEVALWWLAKSESDGLNVP